MGESAATSMLGKTLAIGSHVWDCQQKFRIVFGPLTLEQYYNLLPVNVEMITDHDQDQRNLDRTELADSILLNGQIYTANKKLPWVTALAIHGGRVVRVGGDEEVAALQHDSTRIIDLAGATVLPGLMEESVEGQEIVSDLAPHHRWRRLETFVAQACTDQVGTVDGMRQEALNTALDELLRSERSLDPPEVRGGSIEPGAHADMTVVDQDLRSLVTQNQIDQIQTTRVMMAIFDGKLIYDIRPIARAKTEKPPFQLPKNTSRKSAYAALGTSSPDRAGGPRRQSPIQQKAATPSDASPRDVSLDSLVALVRGYVGDSLQWDTQLILRGHEAPPLGLGLQGHLGWTTWLLREKLPHDSKDLILDAMNADHDTADRLRCRPLPHWDCRTLGQRRDGSIVSSTPS